MLTREIVFVLRWKIWGMPRLYAGPFPDTTTKVIEITLPSFLM